MTRADTIARHVNAYTNALGRVVSNTVGMAAADSEERGRIQRDLHAAMEQSRQHLHLAFLECLGGAAVAGEANGPPEPAPRFVPSPTPEPPRPAGWVIEDTADVKYRWRGNGVRSGGGNWRPLVAEVVPFATESEAREAAKRLAHIDTRVLPVDAAGNVIEAEDIGATLRREECERKAARQSGVAWEAARAGEEAERLRGELAAVKAERDTDQLSERIRNLKAERDAARTELAAVKAERDALNAAEADLRHALRQIAELVGGAVSLGASTDMHCAVANEVRAAVADLRAERDALAAEVQRAREQKPVHLALVDKQGAVVDGYLIKTRALAEDDARRRACTVAPLYLAPVVRDHSGVIAQCEEALNGDVAVRHALRAALVSALAALRGAS